MSKPSSVIRKELQAAQLNELKTLCGSQGIPDISLETALNISKLFGNTESTGIKAVEAHPYNIGGSYFIRTITHHYTGRLESVGTTELILTQAAWIPQTGRFMQAVASGVFEEVEPYPRDHRVILNRVAILDAIEIPILPEVQK